VKQAKTGRETRFIEKYEFGLISDRPCAISRGSGLLQETHRMVASRQLSPEMEPNGDGAVTLTRFHQRLLAEVLTSSGGEGANRVAPALVESKVDLNPHQVEAAVFALESLATGGAMLADEVGLGKTIEAGIVIAQLMSENKKRILIVAPAALRAQWRDELMDKFGLDAELVDGSKVRGAYHNVFDAPGIVISSIPFAANRARDLARIPWDLVVIDEAHRLRNAWRPTHKTGRALRAALEGRPKLLLTATPMQNELLELYGLLSVLDAKVLGPEQAFRSRFGASIDVGLDEAAAAELKDRLKTCVVRTLRRQVREYVQYTNRRSVVEDFAPSPEEQDLYDKVSEYLRRSEAVAIEPGKKTLLTLVYRKLLASSSFAIAPTLAKMAAGLEARLAQAETSKKADDFLQESDPDAYQSTTEQREEIEDDEVDVKKKKQPTMEAMRSEAYELRQYATLAENIKRNAKGDALVGAIQRIFEAARKQKWPEKAVIFTESKRTQQYLFNLLSENGFKDKISVLCGDGSGPEERRQLVIDFKTKTQIMLMTDAGAEGLNLQFCNLLVNYDLPWNPQRVEQRIGRCHRYGQTRDVVVLNLLNRANAADARLYELMEQKLALFDGVFGASDEVLGTLDSGIDFEKRILGIYQECRTEPDIKAAFNKLRVEMDERIGLRMKKARSMMMERFDGDVRGRLRIAAQETKQVVAQRGQDAQALTKAVMGESRKDQKSITEAAQTVKARIGDAISYLELDAGTLPPHLSHLSGKEAWWFVYRFQLTGLRPEERLVHVVLVREGDTFKPLPLHDAARFARLGAKEEPLRRAPAIPVATLQEGAVDALRVAMLGEVNERNQKDLDKERERAFRYCEDCLHSARGDVDAVRAKWTEARHALDHLDNEALRPKVRQVLERADRDYQKKLHFLRTEEERLYSEREKQLGELTKKAAVEERRMLIATAYCFLT
jgi:superfamily II DNA or RNA helicase